MIIIVTLPIFSLSKLTIIESIKNNLLQYELTRVEIYLTYKLINIIQLELDSNT